MLLLSQRPLTASDADRALFVDRDRELAQLERAASYGFNTLLLGDRGSGRTTLIHQLERRCRDGGHRVIVVDVVGVTTIQGLVDAVRIAVHGRRRPADTDRSDGDWAQSETRREAEWVRRPGEDDPSEALRSLGHDIEDRPIVALDGDLDPEIHWQFFGRHRDDLWELPFHWLVTAPATDLPQYVRPPVDSFFDAQIVIGALSEADAAELILRRAQDPNPADEAAAAKLMGQMHQIVGRAEGNPRLLLAAARGVVLDDAATSAAKSQLMALAATLGRSESTMIAELEALGPVSASDKELLERLGWSRARATQVLNRLQEAGVVTASAQRDTGSPGRPRKIYSLNVDLFAGSSP